MSTAAFEACGAIELRVKELKALVEQAKAVMASDEASYDAICRSCCILISSHIEGGISDFSTSAVRDLNYFRKDFHRMPAPLKRTFCRQLAFFEGVPERSVNTRIDQLMTFFDSNSVPIDLDAVTYLETSNNNPKPSSIDKPFKKLGITGTLNALGSDFLLQAFSGSEGKQYWTLRRLKSFRSCLYRFPYGQVESGIFKDGSSKKKLEDDDLWHTFLEEIVSRRNKIAHGQTLENPTSAVELEGDIFKMEVFLRAVSIFFFSRIGN
ncbi:hypothetical protein JMM59_10280 [Rhodovulum sulfidophilum]|uniref:HEPN domain-containing protein n=1 Tax=Rhodovulum sulfidophilum TaxID=35806 RepID=UPI0019215F36|nr:HEPN domain-containing protein [Rhodovulum sulfidophilum]MBL3565387.1 hypothetical protein [Rhodovulum sulfidophilum]